MSKKSKVVAVYADGGIVGKNPSIIGGTWAWCHVDKHGIKLKKKSGIITPVGGPVSNNDSELQAVLNALEVLPFGWSGVVYTDSWVTICRIVNEKYDTLNPFMVERIKNVKARVTFEMVLLGGHPNKKELRAGKKKDGRPVSILNVWCDKTCTKRAQQLLAEQRNAKSEERLSVRESHLQAT